MKKKDSFALSVFFLAWLFIGSVPFFTGCSNISSPGSYEKIYLTLPQWPPSSPAYSYEYPELLKWNIVIQGKSFDKKIEVYNNSTALLAFEEEAFRVAKNRLLSITANPITLNKNNQPVSFFKCAGAIYPQAYEYEGIAKGRITLSWEKGFSAYLLQSLYSSGKERLYGEEELEDFISRFNWRKLEETIQDKMDKAIIELENQEDTVFYNPWLLELQPLLEALASQKLSAGSLTLKNSFAYKIKSLDNKELFLSSFIPENRIIQAYNTLSLAKNKENIFSYDNHFAIIFKGSSEKKLSTEYVLLPIFIEDDENY